MPDATDRADDTLALYIHWPFCLQKCPYCDFNSHVRDRVDVARYGRALLADLAHEAERLGPRRLGSIFFGGGTPSLMPPALVGAMVECARTLFPPGSNSPAPIEITLEANPTSVEAGRFREYRGAGVNRASIGVQALDDADLARLGRAHSAADGRRALALARAVFERSSFDLIYARPGQTEARWTAELDEALGFGADHLSLYQLTIEPGTAFAAMSARGALADLPDDDAAASLYALTGERAARFGLRPYEVSNYAQPGAESRHNLAYWRYADHAAVGPGAHGRAMLDGGRMIATTRHRSPERWLAATETHGHGIAEHLPIEKRDRAREMLIMGLRLEEGIDERRFARRTGMALADALDPGVLEAALEAEYLLRDERSLRTTARGRLLLDALLPRLVT